MHLRLMKTRAAVVAAALLASACTGIVRTSVSSAETEGNNASAAPALDREGRFAAFESLASNLVSGDTNGVSDVFVRDGIARTTTRVSVATNGAQANDASSRPYISSDGRYVAFTSLASNLASGDTDHVADVFVRDLRDGVTALVSNNIGDEARANAISADGRFVLFTLPFVNSIRLADLRTGTVTEQSDPSKCGGTPGPGEFFVDARPAIDADASHIAYVLACGIGDARVFVVLRDRIAGTDRIIVDVRLSGSTSNTLGQVAMNDDAGSVFWWFMSSAGRSGDFQQAFLWQGKEPAALVTVPPGGFAPRCLIGQCAAMSPDGRYLTFETSSGRDHFFFFTCPCRVVLMEIATGKLFDVTQSINLARRDGFEPIFDRTGANIAFSADAADLVPHDANGARDVFTRPVQTVLDPGGLGTHRMTG
jgi:hypothetical protein